MSAPYSANWAQLLREAVTKPGLLLEAYTAFHNYSVGNQILAIVQCQLRGLTPGPLSTFPGWKEKGRHIRKGEKALTLCMPITVKGDNEDERFTRFVYKPRWFVLAQTDGEPLPPVETPAWEYARALEALSVSEAPFDRTDGNVQGYARERSIAVSPIAVLPHKTRFHELGHVILGHTAESSFDDTETTPRSLREVEAEAVALICCETLRLPGADYARGYIQHWLGQDTIPEQSAQRVFRAADQILKAGQPPQEGSGDDA